MITAARRLDDTFAEVKPLNRGYAHSKAQVARPSDCQWRATEPPPKDVTEGLPHDPALFAATVIVAAVEAAAGMRPVSQLEQVLSPKQYEALRVRAGLTIRAMGQPRSTSPAQLRRVRLSLITTEAAEVAIVIEHIGRVMAAAIRLEVRRSKWHVALLEIG